MSITQQGRDSVKEAMLAAEVELIKVRTEYERRLLRYDELVKANACKHKNLRDRGGITWLQTQCEDCGFTWFD